MAVKIRLRRVGAKKQPAYRVVVADARTRRDGRFIEIIGHYNPLTDPATVAINADRALHWLRNGAQPTEAVRDMMVRLGIWSEFTGEPIPERYLRQPEAAAPEAEAAVTTEEAPAEPEVAEEVAEEAAATEEGVTEEAAEETVAEEAEAAPEAPAEEAPAEETVETPEAPAEEAEAKKEE